MSHQYAHGGPVAQAFGSNDEEKIAVLTDMIIRHDERLNLIQQTMQRWEPTIVKVPPDVDAAWSRIRQHQEWLKHLQIAIYVLSGLHIIQGCLLLLLTAREVEVKRNAN